MPLPGQANNPDGRNSFSGPAGQREPAYGQIERSKTLQRMVPVESPGAAAPQKAKRRAMRRGGDGAGAAVAPAPSPALPGADAHVQAEQQQVAFWTALLNDPDSSPLTRQYAQQALSAYTG